MLRSYALTGAMYTGIGLFSAVAGALSGHGAFAGVGVVFICIGAALLGTAAGRTSRPKNKRCNIPH